MASFYLDENVSLGLTHDLTVGGHQVFTTVGERRKGAPDPHQLLYAAERGWTIVTHDGDHFRVLHDAWLLWSHRWNVPQRHSGILVLNPGAGQSASDLAIAITTLLADPDTSLDTALYDWKRSTGWGRFPG